jgi:hypothetical protein
MLFGGRPQHTQSAGLHSVERLLPYKQELTGSILLRPPMPSELRKCRQGRALPSYDMRALQRVLVPRF